MDQIQKLESYSVFLRQNQYLSGNEYSSEWEIDWAQVMPQGHYLLDTTFSSRSLNFSTILGLPTIFCDAFCANTYQPEGGSIHAAQNTICGLPTIPVYSNANITFNYNSTLGVPIYLETRPVRNRFNLKFVKTDSDTLFAPTAQQFYWVIQFKFTRLHLPELSPHCQLSQLVRKVARPFTLYLNSVNGTQANGSNNSLYFEHDWTMHESHYSQKYMLTICLTAMGCNNVFSSGGEPGMLWVDFDTLGANNYASSGGAGGMGSKLLGPFTAPAYENISSMRCSSNLCGGVMLNGLPYAKRFNLQIRTFPSGAGLWTPVTGSVPDFNALFLFWPIY